MTYLHDPLQTPGTRLIYSNFRQVQYFMETFGQEVKDEPEFPDEETQQLRVELIEEELNELKDAIAAKNIIQVADALTDLLYVCYGAGHSFGVDLDRCFAEVQRSNMSKLGADGKPIYREDGKVLKGPNYSDPNLYEILFSTYIQARAKKVQENS